MAWLNAAPIQPEPRLKPGQKAPPRAPAVSRLQRMAADGMEPQLPALSGGGHLIGYLLEVGPVAHAGHGHAAVSWAEMQAWQEQTGIALQPWEARTLRRLSAEFAAELRRAEAPDAMSPMTIQSNTKLRASVSRRIGIEFGAMAAAQRARARQ